jgi:tellurite resistance protein
LVLTKQFYGGTVLQFFNWIGAVLRIFLKYVGVVLVSTIAIGFFLPKEGEPAASITLTLFLTFTWLLLPIWLTIWSEKQRAKKTAPKIPPIIDTKTVVPSAQGYAPTIPVKLPKSTQPQGWIPKGQKVTIAGREIDGMIYIGIAPTFEKYGYCQKARAYVDPTLTVSPNERDPYGSQMSYWPGYHDIPAPCRATYLDWLAGGRKDGSVNAGYLFLFFYGLERRVLIDRPVAAEIVEILEEVSRLQALFGSSHSVRRYLTEFSEFVSTRLSAGNPVSSDGPSDLMKKSVLENQGWDIPLSLKRAIGSLIAKNEAINREWMFLWFISDPTKRLRTPAERCCDEFEALFKLKFDQKHPSALIVRNPIKQLSYEYRAASNEFTLNDLAEVDGRPVPDISGMTIPITISQKIADEAMDELDKFSRYLGRSQNNGRDSIEAQALLPAILWDKFPSNKMIALGTWAADVVVNGGLTPVSKVLEQIQGAAPDPSWKRQLADGADALARLGFGMAPDLRHSLRSPTQTEPVVIFDLGQKVEQVKKASPEYLVILVDITLAAFIAHADKKVVEAERRALYDKVTEATGITNIERRTLKAHVDWYLEVPPDLSIMGSKLKDADADQQALFRAIVVASAHADGIIQSEEVARIERVYKALGLDQALAYSDLHAGQKRDELAVMRKAEADASGEKIPVVPKPSVAPLNIERIAEIQADTARVSMVLGKIFSGEEEVIDVAPLTPTSPLMGLDQKHADFVGQVIQQSHWSENDFDQLAKSGGLMPSGALEMINEWSFQNFGDCLLDAYEGYEVSAIIADNLRFKLTAET